MTREAKPYLTSFSINRRWWYFHTRRRYAMRSYKALGLWIIVVSYKRIEDF